jgi:hypothetical protein
MGASPAAAAAAREGTLTMLAAGTAALLRLRNGSPVGVVKPSPEAAAQRIAEGLGVPQFGQLVFLVKTSLV